MQMSVQKEKSEIESDTVTETEQPTVEVEPDAIVLNSGEITEMMSDVSDNAMVSDFTAPKSNINHGHDTDKHDVRSQYGVRDEFVSEVFADHGIAPNDHAALLTTKRFSRTLLTQIRVDGIQLIPQRRTHLSHLRHSRNYSNNLKFLDFFSI